LPFKPREIHPSPFVYCEKFSFITTKRNGLTVAVPCLLDSQKGGLMNNTRKIMLTTSALGCLALGWLIAVAHGQTVKPPNESAAPEILSVQPIGANGEPHLRPGKKVTLLGKNFSSVLAKNHVSLRIFTDTPQLPPPLCEYVGEIHLTSASLERLEGVAPLSVNEGYYLLWVRVQDGGHSNPVKVWLSAHPFAPPSQPIVVAQESKR
jgi:hypothetical protein